MSSILENMTEGDRCSNIRTVHLDMKIVSEFPSAIHVLGTANRHPFEINEDNKTFYHEGCPDWDYRAMKGKFLCKHLLTAVKNLSQKSQVHLLAVFKSWTFTRNLGDVPLEHDDVKVELEHGKQTELDKVKGLIMELLLPCDVMTLRDLVACIGIPRDLVYRILIILVNEQMLDIVIDSSGDEKVVLK